jgi:dual specificity tyrosine-phosphorylation-regulated kinase 2/3/4
MSLNKIHQKSKSLEKLSKSQLSKLKPVQKPSSFIKRKVSSFNSKNHQPNQSSVHLKPVLNISTSTATIIGPKSIQRKKVLSKVTSPTNFHIKSVLSPPNSKKLKQFMSAKEVLMSHSTELTAYEQSEILGFKEIFYLGNRVNKISAKLDQVNFGFDDVNGNLKVTKGDHLAYRFEAIRMIGKGTFGQVFECIDHKRSEKVALKVIRNKKRFYKQASIELSVLSALRENDIFDQQPVVKLKNSMIFRMHICMVFDLFHYNLYEVVKLNNYKGLSLALVRRFASQILKGLVFLSSLNIVHCDLKLENILLRSALKSEVVLIDFGSSTFQSEKIHTYIQSRFYRAPEIILGIDYNEAIDMWSFGCILVELVTGCPLLPGESEVDQAALIVELIGYPPKEVLKVSEMPEKMMERDELRMENGRIVQPGGRKIEQVVNCCDSEFVDLVKKCLEYDPKKRITACQALNHKWIVGKRANE